MSNIGEPWMWTVFVGFVTVMLAVDLFVFRGRSAHKVSMHEALIWSLVWVSLALVFTGLLWWYLDSTLGREIASAKTSEFLTGYLMEKSLSVDNIFVFLMIFRFFAVPPEYHRRVLLYGVVGALVLRAVMILGGSWIVTQFHWVLYLFGAFLVITGIKMLIFSDEEMHLERNPVLQWMRRHLRITREYHGERFAIMKDGVRWFTPLFLVLVLIEMSDLIFAVDSIPAIFAVTTDPFIIFTSNIFAVLGLRALYFLLADMADRFHLLKYGLAIVLVFVGVKLLIADFYHIPIRLALGMVALIILSSVTASLVAPRKSNHPEPHA